MRKKHIGIIFCLSLFARLPLFAQSHTAVPLENQIYSILEYAEVKGLCTPLSGAKPYTQSTVIAAIREILNSENSGKLNRVEREILEQYLEKNSKPKIGMDWKRGGYYNETTLGKTGILLSANLGTGVDIEGSAGFYPAFDENEFGTETWVRFYLNGDLSRYISYELGVEGGLMMAPLRYLGVYNTYYEGFKNDGEFQNRLLPIYSEPLTHFPYTYKKRWDGSIYFLDDPAGFETWPESLAGAYNLKAELTAALFDQKVIARLGRLSREWGSTSFGSSLSLNQMARPFLGIEMELRPFSWFSIASLTGILEYYNTTGIKDSAMTFQNAFSTTMLQFRYKNKVFLDIGESVVWPKRFELGYPSIITNSFFYQNNIGDFDNMAMFFNLKFQKPGSGNVWFSFFWDEVFLTSRFHELDRTMWALQAGLTFPLPILSFTSLKLSYTVVNPYCYGHNRNYNPWYGDLPMETSYTNNGVSLGYYLPPNSDELLVRFETTPVKDIAAHFQYQMIRHGANFGPDAVDGSYIFSELDPVDRSSSPVLRRYFLRDGAYEWMHILKIGGRWNLPKIPLSLYCEAGTVISYFTNIEEGKANSGEPYPFAVVDTANYPKSTGFIFKLGINLYPR
jgi:hypothetical protein